MRLKRGFDVLVSLAFLCTLFPAAYIIIGAAIRLTSKGPVLFRQQRNGKDGRTFTMLKFRTMVENAEADTRQATRNDRRITRTGRFLRDTSLDELPQFINVLRGDMSVVGPRPHMLRHTEIYSEAIPGYMERLAVRPGITGVAQVLGCRGETPEQKDMERRVRLDLWYIRHRSFALDLRIFLRTLAGFLRMGGRQGERHNKQNKEHMNKKKSIFTLLCLMLLCGSMHAQIGNPEQIRWQRVERDSLPAKIDSLLAEDYVPQLQPTDDRYRVVTNRFWHNWWVYGDIGMHTFRGDWSGNGKFKETLSPDFTVGLGKWFTPGFGIKAQFGLGNSRGFTEIWTPYAVGGKDRPMLKEDGTPYWKLKTKWWDINANVVFNLSRILYAWEGYGSDERFNQVFLNLGLGGIHHIGDFDGWGEPYGGPHNEWYGNVELQYSRFFNRDKAWSLDVKLRGRFYETHFDLSPIAGRRWDFNAGLSIGATYYIKQRGWERCVPGEDINYFINVPAPAPVPVVQDCPEYRTFTFYVFYPNNYSGRNDAPVVPDAKVHSMDYLAGGIFTQKKFKSNPAVASRLKSGASLRSLKIGDVPTEKATFTENPTGVARGYEMSGKPLSLEMDADDLQAFEDVAGYYYAPIYEADKTWCYRIDDETRTQTLLSRDNYKETTSYSLNAHAGLSTVRENMPLEEGTDLYSFADVYAALVGDEGYISRFSDRQAVDAIRDILENARIIHVQAEGLATSQDNYIGENAEAVGLDRNRALSHYRAFSAIKWLRESGKFGGLEHGDFSINVLSEPIGRVDDSSTRGLKAKLNRCARVTIKYIK